MLVDDHDLVRSGLKRLLEEDPKLQVVAEATDGRAAVETYDTCLPDVVLMDISMPVMDGLDASKELLKHHPDARILVLTMHDEEHFAARLLRAGVLGYITKKADSKALQAAIYSVYQRIHYLTDEAKDNLLRQMVKFQDDDAGMNRLSDRELQVLTLIARGKKPKEIAAGLGISVKTVDNHRAHILEKLGLDTNADIILFARDHGFA
jgi:two-component system response regulator NreC